MILYLSFEQEAVLADSLETLKEFPESPYKVVAEVPSVKLARLDYGYVTVADAQLYDGPGAKSPPGKVLGLIGPIEERGNYASCVQQTARLLRSLGHQVRICGEDF